PDFDGPRSAPTELLHSVCSGCLTTTAEEPSGFSVRVTSKPLFDIPGRRNGFFGGVASTAGSKINALARIALSSGVSGASGARATSPAGLVSCANAGNAASATAPIAHNAQRAPRRIAEISPYAVPNLAREGCSPRPVKHWLHRAMEL